MEVLRAYRESVLVRLKPEWLLLASGLWLRAAFVGASALVSGFITLFNGQTTPAFALVIIIAGGALGMVAFRRARQALNRLASPTPQQPRGAAAGMTSPFPRSTREAPAR
jgi:hypothetical protein